MSTCYAGHDAPRDDCADRQQAAALRAFVEKRRGAITRIDPLQVALCVEELLHALGQPTTREGLRDTPQRVARYLIDQCAEEPLQLATFDSEGMDELITVAPIPFYALCEHHLIPFFGTATVGYLPNGRIVGLSKIPRIVGNAARGPQTQERITQRIADRLDAALHPRGVGVVLHARHLCMEMRGVRTPGAHTTTAVMRGAFLDDGRCRREFLNYDTQAVR